MSKSNKVWMVWTCWKCGRRHKNGIRGVLDHVWWHGFYWRCDKCGKFNKVTLKIDITEDYI